MNRTQIGTTLGALAAIIGATILITLPGDRLDPATALPAVHRHTFHHDGLERWYTLHVPHHRDDTPALVFDFHGAGSSPIIQAGLTQMERVADDEGFILCRPAGVEKVWNAGICCDPSQVDQDREDPPGWTRPDDVGFIRALAEHLIREHGCDRSKVFATGTSNGGLMTWRLGIEAADLFAGIAPQSATLGYELQPGQETTPIRCLYLQGGKDEKILNSPFLKTYDETVATWVRINGCDPTPLRITDRVAMMLVDHYYYDGGDAPFEVYWFPHGEHEKPIRMHVGMSRRIVEFWGL